MFPFVSYLLPFDFTGTPSFVCYEKAKRKSPHVFFL